MQIESVPIESLTLDPANARRHPEKNLEAIKGSLAKFGQQKPIVITNDGIVAAGNGTLEAARSLGWTKINAVRTNLTGSDLTAYGLADNRTTDMSEWDDDALGKLLQSLHEEDYPIAEIGFDPGDYDFDAGTSGGGNTDDDEIPEVEENIHGVKRGDIWQLSDHRIMCGDSTSKDDVDRLMQGEKADMVFTDPPYGMNLDTEYSRLDVGYTPNRENHTAKAKRYKKVEGDDVDFDPSFLMGYFSYCQEQFWWGADYYRGKIDLMGSWLVWDKSGGNEQLDKMIGSAFELCWSRQKHQRLLARITYRSLFGSNEGKSGHTRVHPTQKPVKLAEWFFERWGKDKNLIVDLFLGSGSTLIACEKTGRKCYGMEIDPHYCSVIIERWQNYSGRKAIKGDG